MLRSVATLICPAMKSFRRVESIRTGERFRKRLKWVLKNRDLMVYKALGWVYRP
jgi:hypothetical protein